MIPTNTEPEPLPNPPAAAPRPSAAAPVSFRAALERGPLVLDSGMGSRLCGRGLDIRRDDPCLWSLDRPEDVLDVHRRDAAAGCRVLFTNTFGANRSWLARFGRRGDMEAINRAAVGLARQAVRSGGFLVGDIGPSVAGEPGAAGEQATVLIDSGVDALIFETFRLEAALVALSEVRAVLGSPALPMMVGLWHWPDAVEDAAQRLVDAGAAIVGLNCRPGLTGTLPRVRRLAAAVACPLLVKPGVDASDPDSDSSPAAFAAAVPELVAHNVRLIGGCCGTTEAHVAALAAACDRYPLPDTAEPRGAAP